jgi:hypothetical protein
MDFPEYFCAPGRQPSRRPKTIFEDSSMIISKGRQFLMLYQKWQEDRASGKVAEPLFDEDVARKLDLSLEDARQLREFALSPEFGEFERDTIFGGNPTFLDHDGNELSRPNDPFGFGDR